jgi:hypothetical protein
VFGKKLLALPPTNSTQFHSHFFIFKEVHEAPIKS